VLCFALLKSGRMWAWRCNYRLSSVGCLFRCCVGEDLRQHVNYATAVYGWWGMFALSVSLLRWVSGRWVGEGVCDA
jgi:hypothetical protein